MVSEDMVTQLVTHLRQEAYLPTWKVIDAECELSLRVTETKATYFFRVRRPKQISRSLGDFGDISTIEAYQKGQALAVTLRNGDPLPASKTRPSDLTVRQKSLSWLLKTWREDEVSKPYPRWSPTDRKAAVKFLGLIGNYVEPHFQGLSFTKISGEELADFLTDFHRHHPSSAKSLFPWIEAAFMWAERKGLCSDGHQKAQRMRMLVKDARWRRHGPPVHHPALPVSDVPEFMAELREVGGTTARCLEVAILTVSRVQSIANMKWEHIDFEKGIWRCPKEDMKVQTNGDHFVYPKKTFIAFSYPYLSALIPIYPNLSQFIPRRATATPLHSAIGIHHGRFT